MTPMNHSLITADRRTHSKIVAVALIAAIAVIGVGLTARLTDSGSPVVAARSESVGTTHDAGKPVLFAGGETTGLH